MIEAGFDKSLISIKIDDICPEEHERFFEIVFDSWIVDKSAMAMPLVDHHGCGCFPSGVVVPKNSFCRARKDVWKELEKREADGRGRYKVVEVLHRIKRV